MLYYLPMVLVHSNPCADCDIFREPAPALITITSTRSSAGDDWLRTSRTRGSHNHKCKTQRALLDMDLAIPSHKVTRGIRRKQQRSSNGRHIREYWIRMMRCIFVTNRLRFDREMLWTFQPSQTWFPFHPSHLGAPRRSIIGEVGPT